MTRPHRKKSHHDVSVVHQSGFAHADYDQWTAMLKRNAVIDRHPTHVMLTTESASHEARSAIADFCRKAGLDYYHPEGAGPGQCALMAREEITREKVERLTDLTLKSARKAPINAVRGYVYDSYWDVWHSPAHNDRLSPGWPTKVYFSSMAGLEAMGGSTRAVFADWNAPLDAPHIQRELLLPGMKWAVGHHQHGTHGKHLIDGGQVSKNIEILHRSRTLREIPGAPDFDHRGIQTVLRIWY